VTQRWWTELLNGSDQGALYLAIHCMPKRGMSIPDFARYLLRTADPELHRLAIRLSDGGFVKSFLFLLPLLPHLGFTIFEWGPQVLVIVLPFSSGFLQGFQVSRTQVSGLPLHGFCTFVTSIFHQLSV
jgi:hypothetical protein